jgi:uncharacterized protein
MNLLSIKGGGSRGLISVRLLMEIEKITKTPIYQLFDFFGGSSVGSLICCGILVSEDGKNPLHTAAELYQLFLQNITNCFTWSYRSYLTSGFGLFGPKYTIDGLQSITHQCCAHYRLNDLLQPVIFPVYDRANNKTYYFDKEKNGDLLLSDIILSTVAAPTFFKSHEIEIDNVKHDFVDSGLVANNNSELTFLKATKHMKVLDKSKILLLNLGTGYFQQTVNNKQGLFGWIPNIVDTLMYAGEQNELYELSLSLSEENYMVIDIPLDLKYGQLDNATPEAIEYYISATDKWIDENQELLKFFCDKLVNNKNDSMKII